MHPKPHDTRRVWKGFLRTFEGNREFVLHLRKPLDSVVARWDLVKEFHGRLNRMYVGSRWHRHPELHCPMVFIGERPKEAWSEGITHLHVIAKVPEERRARFDRAVNAVAPRLFLDRSVEVNQVRDLEGLTGYVTKMLRTGEEVIVSQEFSK